MNRVMRRKLAMANRVRDFCRAHPGDTPGYLEAVEQLEKRITRINELADLATGGVTRAKRNGDIGRELRSVIREKYLRNLVRIARGATDVDPDLAEQFALPSKRVSITTFLSEARRMVHEAAMRESLFVHDGMPANFVAEANDLLTRYEEISGRSRTSQARLANLKEIEDHMESLMQVIRRLEGINLLRFQEDAGLQAGWHEARVMYPAA